MAATVRLAASSSPPRQISTFIGRTEVVLLAATITCGLATWTVGIDTLAYDYDEVMRAHSIWLTAQGLRPYRDFLDCHPPYFALLTPLARTDADPAAFLRSLRVSSAIGNLVFLAGLAALGMLSVPSARHWAVLGLAIVAFHPAILEFLVEFRIDGWGYAIATWSIYRFRRSSGGIYRCFELGVFPGIASFLLCPKLALLPALIIVAEQVVNWESGRRAARAVAAYIAGVAVAGAMFALYLAWQGINIDRTFELLVRYHAVSNANSGVRTLWQTIAVGGLLAWLIFAGALTWSFVHIRTRSRPEAYELGLGAWLVIQALIVAYPYKQYYAPWFLFASAFLVRLGAAVANILPRARIGVFVMACALTVIGDLRTAQQWSRAAEAKTQQLFMHWMNRVTHPEDRVVASPPFHPIYRYDAFFVWFTTFDTGGFDTEQILARLPTFQPHVTAARFRQELAEFPPALVVLSGDWRFVPYTPGQRAALAEFLKQRGYLAVQLGTAWFALRPDRFEEASRDGLLELTRDSFAIPPTY